MTLPRSRANSAALVHLLHARRGDVEVVPLDLAGVGHRVLHRVHAVEESLPPAVEGLRVGVLVVLDEVEAAAEGLVDHAPVVAWREAELGLGGGAEEWAAVLVQHLAFVDDPVGRPLEGLHVLAGDADVLQPQRLEGLEPEDVADDRGGHVGDRTLLEEVQLVGDVSDVLRGIAARHGLDAIGLALVVLEGGEAIGPDHRPRRRG